MKLASTLLLGSLTALGVGLSGLPEPAIAAQFDQAEVDQSRFVAIASPYAGGSAHRLVILEQISNSRPCWRENGSTIDPLLLSFDFTGICGRNPDSNGYSIRVAGQDLGTQYMLRIRRRGNELVLLAEPGNARTGRALEIGRTVGTSNGLTRIQLNSGWRFTKRVFSGQQLGHIYLTNDQPLPTLIAAASRSSGLDTGNRGSWDNGAASNGSWDNGSPNGSWSNGSRNTGSRNNGSWSNDSGNRGSRSSGSWNRRSSNSDSWDSGSASNGSSNRGSWDSSSEDRGSGTAPRSPVAVRPNRPAGSVEIPVIPPEGDTWAAPRASNPGTSGQSRWNNGGLAVLPVPAPPPTPQGQRPPGSTNLPPVSVSRPPAPGSEFSWSSSGAGLSAPGATAAQLGFSYRVIVQAVTPDAQAQVRALVPDAFRTIINGQTVMQAGLFRDMAAAQALQQTLSSQNLVARVVPVQ